MYLIIHSVSINFFHSLTTRPQPTWHNLISVQSIHVEPAPVLLFPLLCHLYLPQYKSPIAHLTYVKSTSSFIPSTSSCSLFSWFTSCSMLCAVKMTHLAQITSSVPVFILTIYHSLSFSIQIWNPSVPYILSSIVSLFYLYCLHGISTRTRPSGHLRFYPRDAMLARVIAIATCPSVRHAPVLCQNEES